MAVKTRRSPARLKQALSSQSESRDVDREDPEVLDEALEQPTNGELTSSFHFPERVTGVVIGSLTEVTDGNQPRVEFPGCPSNAPLSAVSTVPVAERDVGRQVALAFENGDPEKPIILGLIYHPGVPQSAPASGMSGQSKQNGIDALVDGDRITLTATREIVLRCGKASITLTRAGKVLVRGAYLLSRSSGVNRIKGGSVHIN